METRWPASKWKQKMLKDSLKEAKYALACHCAECSKELMFLNVLNVGATVTKRQYVRTKTGVIDAKNARRMDTESKNAPKTLTAHSVTNQSIRQVAPKVVNL